MFIKFLIIVVIFNFSVYASINGENNQLENVADTNKFKEGTASNAKIEDDSSILLEKKVEPLEHRLHAKLGDSLFDLSFFYQPEMLISKNLWFLNDNLKSNIFFMGNIFNIVGNYKLGEDIAHVCWGPRVRVIWGNRTIVPSTTVESIFDKDVGTGSHAHGNFFNFFWLRQLWIELNLSHLFNIPFCNKHTLTLGAFPFELGHGVSLGKAYLFLPFYGEGYYIDIEIDQYAFGGKLSGVINDRLNYDLYGAFIREKRFLSTGAQAGANINLYGHRTNKDMDVGTINYVLAGRLKIDAIKRAKNKKLYIEPYALYASIPSANALLIDASISNLYTVGIFSQMVFNRFSLDIEYAHNFGGEHISGVDFNINELKNNGGVETIVNSQVIDSKTDSKALVTSENQEIIDSSYPSIINNGRSISNNLINSNCRFQDPYKINYKGSLFIAELSYEVMLEKFRINGWYGYSSGDKNRYRKKPVNGVVDYYGFIPVNEAYNGRRVSSLIVLGYGEFLHFVSDTTNQDSKFYDIDFFGGSLEFFNEKARRPWNVIFNGIAFYKDSDIYVHKNNGNRAKFINKFLGIELNIVAEVHPFRDLNFFFFPAVFVPGTFFNEIKQFPTCGLLSLLSNDSCWYVNTGFQYSF